MDKLKTGNLSDKVEFVAQIGSLLFALDGFDDLHGGENSAEEIIKTIKGEEPTQPAPVQ